MTATEQLRAMLDKRGVEWGTGFGGDTLWTGRHCIEWRWDKQEGTLAMYTHAITPAQAVEATLGRGECRPLLCDNLTETCGNGYAWAECSVCGALLAVLTEADKMPNYCPNCGRKVVDD